MDILSGTLLLTATFLNYLFVAGQNLNNGGISAFQALDDLRQIPQGDVGAIVRAMASAVPGRTYPILSSIPSTAFTCTSVPQVGYYADTETGCQVFRMCLADGTMESFICSNQTLFNQITLVCDWWYNVNCSKSPTYYSFSNPRIYQQNMRFLDDGNSVDIGASSGGYRPTGRSVGGSGIVPASLVVTARPPATTARVVRPQGRSLQTSLTSRRVTEPHAANFHGQMTTEGVEGNGWPGFDSSTDQYDEFTETTDAMNQEASEFRPPSSYSSGEGARREEGTFRIQVTAGPSRRATTVRPLVPETREHAVPGEGGHVQVVPPGNPDHVTSGSETSEHVVAHETAHVELANGVRLNISIDQTHPGPAENSEGHAETTEEPAAGSKETHSESGHGEAAQSQPMEEGHVQGTNGVSAESSHRNTGAADHPADETANSGHEEADHEAHMANASASNGHSSTAGGHEASGQSEHGSPVAEIDHSVSGQQSHSAQAPVESASHTNDPSHAASVESGHSAVGGHEASSPEGHAEEADHVAPPQTGHEVPGQASAHVPEGHSNEAGHDVSDHNEANHEVSTSESPNVDQPVEVTTPEVRPGNQQIAVARESSRSPSTDRNRAEAAARALPDAPLAAPHESGHVAGSSSHDAGRNLQVHRPSVELNPVFRDRTEVARPNASIPLPGMIFSANQNPSSSNRISIVPTTPFGKFSTKKADITTTPATTARLTAKRKIFIRTGTPTSGKPLTNTNSIAIKKEKLLPTRELDNFPASSMSGKFDGRKNDSMLSQSNSHSFPRRDKFAGFH